MREAKDKAAIIACECDAAGFTVQSEPLEAASYFVRFIVYRAEQCLEEAAGMVIPSAGLRPAAAGPGKAFRQPARLDV
jgi:hypothetical protein